MVTSVCKHQYMIIDLTPPLLHIVEDVFYDEDFDIMAVYYEVSHRKLLLLYYHYHNVVVIATTATSTTTTITSTTTQGLSFSFEVAGEV